MFKKNTAVTGLSFGLLSATDGSDITTGTVNAYVTLDGGTQGSITDTPVHKGNGQWSVDLTAAEMNGDTVGLVFTHTSAATVHMTIKTALMLTNELNDIAATDIVSGGAITTSSGSVSSVTTVDTTTTNTDMVDVSGLATAASISALNDIAATDIVSNGAINTSSGAVSTVTTVGTTTTNTDMIDVSSLATSAALATVDSVVDDLSTRIPAALVGGKIDAEMGSISGSTAAADNIEANALRVVPVTFAAGGTTTTAVLATVDGATPSSTNDKYNGRTLIFSAPSGLVDEGCTITDYDGTTKIATISQVTSAVGNTAVAILT